MELGRDGILVNAIGGTDRDLSVELRYTQLVPGDQVLLCTDGLHKQVSDEAIAAQLAQVGTERSVEQCVRGLIEAANAAGGGDNVSVVLEQF